MHSLADHDQHMPCADASGAKLYEDDMGYLQLHSIGLQVQHTQWWARRQLDGELSAVARDQHLLMSPPMQSQLHVTT